MPAKVNIVTPVYNGEQYIHRLLDSILTQTYPNISMYVINDGSTDGTKAVVEHYIPLFVKKGYDMHHIYQENGGQSAALNKGLKFLDGDYFMWPDADDWYKSSDAIKTMVDAISQTRDEVGIVRCQLEFIDEESQKVTYTSSFSPCNTPCNLLEDAIYEKNNFLYAPIEWIAKVKFIDSFIPNREIFVHKKAGQNAQILLPYLGYSKCVTIDKVLCCYLVRKSSHSHLMREYQKQVLHFETQLSAYVHTLQNLDKLHEKMKEEYIQARRMYYYRMLLSLDYEFANRRGFRKHYKESLRFHLPIVHAHMKLWIWTYIFDIISYKWILRQIHRFKGWAM